MSDEWVELVDDAWQLELQELAKSGRTYQAFTEEWYAADKRIHHGAFGSVRWALSRRDHDRGTARAAKVMDRSNSDYYARWAAEVYAHRKVSGHQNIVELFDIYFTSHVAGYDKAKLVLIQQLCERDDLYKHMQYYYNVSMIDTRYWMQDLLRALAHVHAHGIIHRDVKPSNCCLYFALGRRKLLKLTDFGWAALLRRKVTVTGTEEVTDPGTGRGFKSKKLNRGVTTFRYVAPDVIKREQYNWVADVWSGGVIYGK